MKDSSQAELRRLVSAAVKGNPYLAREDVESRAIFAIASALQEALQRQGSRGEAILTDAAAAFAIEKDELDELVFGERDAPVSVGMVAAIGAALGYELELHFVPAGASSDESSTEEPAIVRRI